jgi:photosystem II stability/assembly factor-like uncharacterized protein
MLKQTYLFLVGLACTGYCADLHRPVSIEADDDVRSLAALLLGFNAASKARNPTNLAATRVQPVVMASDRVSRRDVVRSATVTTAGAGALGLAAIPDVAQADDDDDDDELDKPVQERRVKQIVGKDGIVKAVGNGEIEFKDEEWEVLPLPFTKDAAPVLFDLDFDDKDPNVGIIIGSSATLIGTDDGGKTWKSQFYDFGDDDEDINYRYTSVSFKDGEGWIVGKPPILLHTRDSGSSWERIGLNTKLPGDPTTIVATGPGEAWMTTSTGAIYKTENAGRNFIAQVQEAIDATINRITNEGVKGGSYFSGSVQNIARDTKGNYIAVASRGNFYLTWSPGNEFWLPHNRQASRRITSMGFIQDDVDKGLWMASAGGDVALCKGDKVDTAALELPFRRLPGVRSGGVGILDVVFLKDGKTAFAVGGGGLLLKSTDGGKKWKRNSGTDGLPTNLYKLKSTANQLYALGSGGVVLKYKQSLA